MSNINHLNHSSYECKYHIVFTPKYRKKEFFWGYPQAIERCIPPPCTTEEVRDSGGIHHAGTIIVNSAPRTLLSYYSNFFENGIRYGLLLSFRI